MAGSVLGGIAAAVELRGVLDDVGDESEVEQAAEEGAVTDEPDVESAAEEGVEGAADEAVEVAAEVTVGGAAGEGVAAEVSDDDAIRSRRSPNSGVWQS